MASENETDRSVETNKRPWRKRIVDGLFLRVEEAGDGHDYVILYGSRGCSLQHAAGCKACSKEK